jgi:hypothetical protein
MLHNRLMVGFFVFLAAFFVWITLRSPEMAERPLSERITFGIFFSLFLLCSIALGQFGFLVLWILLRKGRGMFGHHELIVRDDGLLERTDVNESLHRWPGFHKIISSGGYLYIFVTDTQAHVVPKRCFTSTEEQLWLEQVVKSRMKSPQ